MDFNIEGLETYLPDQKLESEVGIWISFPGGRQFRCLRAGGSNRKYATRVRAAMKPYERQLERGTMDPEAADQLLWKIYSNTVVVDWRGILDAEGHEVPYSSEACVEFFKAVPELFSELNKLCSNMAMFTETLLEEAKATLGEA